MPRNRSALLASLALSQCLFVSNPAGALPGDLRQFVLTDRDAYLLDTPVSAALGDVDFASWSSNGKFVLSRRNRTDPRSGSGETALCLWSAETQKSRELLKVPSPAVVDWAGWLPGTDVALALVLKPAPPVQPAAAGTAAPELQKWVMRIDARRGTVQPLLRVPADTEAGVSPTRPLAWLSSYERMLGVLGPDGAVRDLTPALPTQVVGSPRWSTDGATLWIHGAPNPPAGQKVRFAWYTLDPQAPKLTGPAKAAPPDDSEGRSAASDTGAFRLRLDTVPVVREKTHRDAQPLWIESAVPSEQPLALVTANCTGGPMLSPRRDAVLYLGEGGAWVRPLVRFDKAAFLEARDTAWRATLMSNAKQLGTGLLVYAQGHGEELPAAGADLGALLLPIVKHGSLFEDFVYTFPGGKLGDVAEPSSTVLGYTPAPGGRVWLYADGHVKFARE